MSNPESEPVSPEEVDVEADASASTPTEDPEPDPAHAGDDTDTDDTVEALVATMESVTNERDQHLHDLQRVTAEFANFRKQTEKRHTEFVAHATARLAEALLPVLDACDAAASQGIEGVDRISQQLLHVLQQEGLEVIAEEAAPFDPNLHEAAITEDGDDSHDGPVVGEVLRTGYSWNGRVLRAAMVKVKG